MGGMPINAVWNQQSFRWRNDDGSETSATWIAAANAQQNFKVWDTPRIRFLIQETAGSNQSETPRFGLEYRINRVGSGGFTAWDTTENNSVSFNIVPISHPGSSNYTNRAAATQQLGSGTFNDGEIMSSSNSTTTTGLSATNGNDEYEVEFKIEFRDNGFDGGVQPGDVIELRIAVGSPTTALGSYTNTPSITIQEPTAGSYVWSDLLAQTTATSSDPTSASFTPTADTLLVVTIAGCTTDDPTGDISVSGGSLSWTQRVAVNRVDATTGEYSFAEIWTAVAPSSPSSMTVSVSSGASTFAGVQLTVFEARDADTSSPIADSNTASGQNVANLSDPTISFSGATAATSLRVGVYGVSNSVDTACIGPTNNGDAGPLGSEADPVSGTNAHVMAADHTDDGTTPSVFTIGTYDAQDGSGGGSYSAAIVEIPLAVQPYLDQTDFRFRHDDGTEAAATWANVKNEPAPAIPLDEKFRLRLLIKNTTAGAANISSSYLQFRRNGGSWTGISPSQACINADSSYITPFQQATQQLGSGTFRDGVVSESNTTGTLSASTGNDEFELEWVLSFSSTNGAAVGDIFEFRVSRNITGTNLLDAYTVTPTVIAGESSTGVAVQDITKGTQSMASSTSMTSASFTPADNSLLVVMMSVDTDSYNTSNITISDTQSLTWTKQVENHYTDGVYHATTVIWTAPVTTGASMTITVGSGATGTDADGAMAYQVMQAYNNSGSGSIDAVQDASTGGTSGRSGALTVSFSANVTVGNVVFNTGVSDDDPTGTITPTSSWDDLYNIDPAGSFQVIDFAYRNDEYTGTDAAAYSTFVAGFPWAVSGIEIGFSGSPTGTGAISTTVPTLSGSGTIGRSGSGAISTPVVTLSGSGFISRSGSGAITTTVPTLSGTGALVTTGSGAITTTVPTLSGSGTVAKSGSGAIDTTLPTLAGSGTIIKTGTASINTTVPTLSGSGFISRSGSGAINTPVVTLSGSGTIIKTGSGAITTTVPTLSGTGVAGKVGSGAITTTVPTLSGTGEITKTGSGAISTVVPTLSGSGFLTRVGSGTISTTVPTLSGSGTITKTGSGAITTPVPTLSGTGAVSAGVLGSGAITTTVPTLAGSGDIVKTGSAAINTTVPTLSGAGVVVRIGSGAITTPVPALNGNGQVVKTGSGAINTTVPTLAGTGTVGALITGSGAINTPVATLSGSGFLTKTGSGDITTPVALLAGSGTVGRSGSGAITTPAPSLFGSGTTSSFTPAGGGMIRRRRRAA